MTKLHFCFKLILLLAIYLVNPWPFTALADEFHEEPYDFLFGNHMDPHQETRLTVRGGAPKRLNGFLYIIITGEIDSASGLPIARHPRGAEHNEVCGGDSDDDFEDEGDGIDCVVGWTMKGKPGKAKFLYHEGVNGNDHPVWMVNRTQIRQPGSYNHFHWIGRESNDPRADEDYPEPIPAACDKMNASDLENQDPSAVNVVCPGWFLQIRAVAEFAFDHGGEKVPVRPGIDNATHLNLVTNYAEVPDITATRSDEGSH